MENVGGFLHETAPGQPPQKARAVITGHIHISSLLETPSGAAQERVEQSVKDEVSGATPHGRRTHVQSPHPEPTMVLGKPTPKVTWSETVRRNPAKRLASRKSEESKTSLLTLMK